MDFAKFCTEYGLSSFYSGKKKVCCNSIDLIPTPSFSQDSEAWELDYLQDAGRAGEA